MTALFGESEMPPDDGGDESATGGPVKRAYRNKAETMEAARVLREAEPDLSEAEIARRLGISPAHWRKLRNGRTTDEPASKPGRRSAGNARKAELVDKLCDPLAKFAMGLMFIAPTVAMVLTERAEVTARAVIDVASQNPRFLAALERVSTSASVFELVQTGLMCAIGASLDFGKLPPDHPMAVLTGVAAHYHRVHPAEDTGPPPPAIPFPVPTPGAPLP